MGRTKALVEVDGVPMASRVATALAGVGCDTVVAVGGDVDTLAILDLPIVPDRTPGQGPLGGIIAGMEFFSDRSVDVFVVACDLPFVTDGHLAPIVALSRERPEVDAVVAVSGRREPGCAIWHSAALPKVSARFDSGERAVHRVLQALDTVEVAVAATAMRNINTLDDLGRYP